MNKMIAAVLLAALAAPSYAFDGAYFKGIWENQNYKSPIVSEGTLLTMKGAYDGETGQVAIAWHQADPNDTLIPQSLQNIGIKPFSWTLLNCGGGYGNGTGLLTCGSSINVAPTLLGPIAQPLKASSNALAHAAGVFIAGTPSGTGLALGYVWNMIPVQNATIMPLDRWGSHLDAFLGASYAFGPAPAAQSVGVKRQQAKWIDN